MNLGSKVLLVVLCICIFSCVQSQTNPMDKKEGNLSDRRKKVIVEGLKKRIGTNDQFELVDWQFRDTIEQWSSQDSSWEKRLRYKVKFDYRKEGVLQKREAGIVLFINKDSVNNAVILPR